MSKEHLASSSFHAQPHALFDDSGSKRTGKSRQRKLSYTAERVAIIKPERNSLSSGVGLRLGALIAFCAALCLIGYICNGVYHAFADSVVAPIILAPDSDLVTSAKLSLNKLLSERDGIQRRLLTTESCRRPQPRAASSFGSSRPRPIARSSGPM